MARIKKLKENGATIYPATILDAVVDSKTSTPITKTRLRYSRASAHGRYYKFLTLKRGLEKGIIRFGIESPLMGYADYMVNWTYDTNTEKGMNLYCLFSTNAQMYNRVKLVRTGNDTFDVYFESNAGNDYPAFVFMGEGGMSESSSITNYIVSIVSSIPENIYKESAGTPAYFHNDVYVLRDYAKGDPILKFISPGHIEKWIRLNRTNNHLEIVDSNGSLTELYASSFVGDLKGTADNSENDENGDNIVNTYSKKADLPVVATSSKAGLVKSGGNITVGSDGTVTVNQSKVADNANKLGNYGLFTSSSGSPAGHVPLIGADGVMKAGCYIDFHAQGNTSDYNLRLMYDEGTDKKRWIKFPKASGTMALMNLIDSEDSAITIKSNCADFPAIDIIAGVTGNGMRITMSDAVDTGKLEFDGNLVWIDKQTDTSVTLYVSDDVLYCNKDISSKGFYQSSDIRIKKNIREICRNDNRLEMAGDLSLKEFDMAGTERHAFGFIAQEVREKFPELVSEDKNGFLSLDYTSLLLLKIGFLEKKLSEVMSKLNNMDKRTNH